MHDLVHDGAQFIIATHSPILLGYPDARISVLTDDGIAQSAYEENGAIRTDALVPRRPRALSPSPSQ
jgi:predicted ATPase